LYNLNTQIVVSNKIIGFLYMFRAQLCSSSGGQIVLYSIWYRHTLQVHFSLYMGGCLVCCSRPDSHPYRV